ncbi:cytochrome c3 family protein [Mangrovibacterium lignilyticum]|uniref:cytochrome c3 family protein n=1 Tax=Mangrovibacterium lignilyticum TaxID=2668052 RepID=UPI0013D0D8CB|nr:cytochrome c3 family protein [Mangrovibacterium lignilyticum]
MTKKTNIPTNRKLHSPDKAEGFQVQRSFPQLVLLLLCATLIFSCHRKESAYNKNVLPNQAIKDTLKSTEYAVEAPPLTEGIFPCSDCHSELEPNPERRTLDWHEEITGIFDHDSENRWCLDCHDLENRDSLRLASGKLLNFKESYKLCGQCHGEKLRDWKVGVHGKRTGEWNGEKEYLLCVHCHNPHAPKFESLTPEPPPVRQEDIQ